MKHPSSDYVKLSPLGPEQKSGPQDDLIHRGTVEEVGTGIMQDPEDHERWGEVLKPNTVVYYRGGIRIEDSIFISAVDIIAYED